MALSREATRALQEARVGDPFGILGLHHEGETLCARIWQREATRVQLRDRSDGTTWELQRSAPGLFEAPLPERQDAFAYELLVDDAHGAQERLVRDPYGFWLQLSEWDLDRFREGRHHHIGSVLGAVPATVDQAKGVRFAVWAPTAERVSVIGDWNGFDGRWHPMRLRHPYGVWELFIPGVAPGAKYKYEIRGRDGSLRVKADPYARQAELPPATASIVSRGDAFAWGDQGWMERRGETDWRRRPLAIYEVHIGSWQRAEGDRQLGYRELAHRLIEHCRHCGFTHVEFLPLAAHPYEGSWGYQVSGHYAPNARHGDPDDLRHLIDALHRAGIGVLVDFVPGHFPKDDFALAHFDGHPLYEYADPKEGEHREWGTKIFNWRRPEVRNFLLGAALYWLETYHIDGLRVDAVSSMLYRDYDREEGEWVANEHGGKENVEAIRFLQELTSTVHRHFPGALMIAEESTAWPGVTRSTDEDGLGFDLKWNMGWMHDSLRYFQLDPLMRSGSHDTITFHQWYAYDERWVLPLSHDEVVHGKGSLLARMPGDYTAQLTQLRMLQLWQAAVPGRPLLFQGAEFGQGREWDWRNSVDWHEAEDGQRRGVLACLREALRHYREQPALYLADDERDGFRWVDCENRAESIIAFLRQAPHADPVPAPVIAVFNFTPVPRPAYPLGVPDAVDWRVLQNSDALDFGGQGYGPSAGDRLAPTGEHRDGWAGVVRVDLPPCSAILLQAIWDG